MKRILILLAIVGLLYSCATSYNTRQGTGFNQDDGYSLYQVGEHSFVVKFRGNTNLDQHLIKEMYHVFI